MTQITQEQFIDLMVISGELQFKDVDNYTKTVRDVENDKITFTDGCYLILRAGDTYFQDEDRNTLIKRPSKGWDLVYQIIQKKRPC